MSKIQKLVKNKLFIALGSLFIIFMLVAGIRQYRVRRQVQIEINDLSKQADSLQKNNQDLQNMIAYLKTDSYKEKAAREQLSMSKPGESVYSFSTVSNASAAMQQQAADAQAQQDRSNLSKWWAYFFRSN